MERVQFQQEQMLAELKDLELKGLFTQKEIKDIVKKRTAFETALVRRIPKKADFLRYATYEMGLEALRRKRIERLKLPPSPPSVSDYALVRRQFHIFERALKKFKADVGLWIQYIQVAKKEGARALVGRITARALQLHPNVPALYILAASHELEHLSPAAARALLQRGIRINADSVEMWREYAKMELGFIETLRRRWGVLGIDIGPAKGKQRAGVDAEMDEEETEQLQGDAEQAGDEGEAARREIMNGAIVKSVIASAAKALPRFELFASLQGLLTTYPVPDFLRDDLLDYVHVLMRAAIPHDPKALKLAATRTLIPGSTGTQLIDALRHANETLLTAVRDCGPSDDAVASVYAEFVTEWCQKAPDVNIKLYLFSSLRGLLKSQRDDTSPALAAAAISLLIAYADLRASAPFNDSVAKILRFVRECTEDCTVPSVWLARLEAERLLADAVEVERTWREARTNVTGTAEQVSPVWLWGLRTSSTAGTDGQNDAEIHILESLLRESMQMQSSAAGATIHEMLLLRMVHTGAHRSVVERTAWVRRLASDYLPSAQVWAVVFAHEADDAAHNRTDQHQVLATVYEWWRRRDATGAAIAWGQWLMTHGEGREAMEVIVRATAALDGAERATLEQRWAAILELLGDEDGDVRMEDA